MASRRYESTDVGRAFELAADRRAARAVTAKTVCVPRVLEIRRGAIADVAVLLAGADFPLGRTVVGTGGARTARIAAGVVRQLRREGTCAVVPAAAPTAEGVSRLVEAIRRCRAEVCIAVGGGRVIDAVKHACSLTDTRLVSLPTSLAHDGISSPIASLVGPDGRRTSVGAVGPDAVVVDLDVVQGAPPRTSRAGAADLLSNLTALADWRLAVERGRDTYDGFSALVAEEAARSLLGPGSASPGGSLETLARGLVLSGLAMAAARSSRPCSGAEHLISHSLDRLLGNRARLHGEQVALGVLIAGTAQGSLTPELAAAYDRWSLPRSPRDLGLDRGVVVEAVIRARETRPARYTILDELELSRSGVEALVEQAFATGDSRRRHGPRLSAAAEGDSARQRPRPRTSGVAPRTPRRRGP
ncbi:MAG: iron-containing alcohol dehydrogenase [Thermoleophilia bacterium]|nr:iron-containing alcohol dehydrogenase [Thermoleophilia bacterium]